MTQPDDVERFEIEIGAGEGGERVDRLLAARLPALSRSRIKALIEAGRLASGERKVVEPSAKVKPGERLVLEVPAPADARPQGQDIPLAILYEDAAVIVVDKPAGMVVHPAPGNPDRTLVNALISHCGESLTGIGGERRPGIVHRLDKDTSGVMVAAKTAAAHEALTRQFAERSITRRYQALVWGRPAPLAGEVVGAIGRSPRNRKKMAVVRRGGKAAETRYETLESYRDGAVSRLACALKTGRTHQIRVHMTHIGHPLLGDPLYGRARPARLSELPAAAQAAVLALGRQALHAETLGFVHPATGGRLSFESPLPPDITHVIETLEAI